MLVIGEDNTKAIIDILNSEGTIKCAVAFWGMDSVSLIKKTTKPIKIICNLESGATNPFVLKKLKNNKKIIFKSHPKLHAKVYWSGQKCLVGSANCSANGLSYENDEMSGWLEAGIVAEDKKTINEAEKWFDNLWESLEEVKDSDIDDAIEIYKKRRCTRQFQKRKGSILNLFSELPESFKDKRIFFVLWADEASNNDKIAFKRAKIEGIPEIASDKLDFYVDWPQIPTNAHLISFKYHPRRNTEPTGFLISKTLDKHVERKGHNDSTLIICPIENNIEGLKLPRDKSIFKKIASKLWEKGKGDDYGKILDIYEAKDILISALKQ